MLDMYEKSGENKRWDVFRLGLKEQVLKLWGEILIECRRNGFIAPHVKDGWLRFRQVISTDSTGNADLCTMCERPCERREVIDSGEAKRLKLAYPDRYREKPPCWAVADQGEKWIAWVK